MGSYEQYIYKKEVDWSVLHQGISIPVTIQVAFLQNMKSFLKRGETKEIKLLLDGKEYPAKLVNQDFDSKKYQNHKDILQIRYNPQSSVAIMFREIFLSSFNYISKQKVTLQQDNEKKLIKVPDEFREYLAIYTTEFTDIFYLECITAYDTKVFNQTMIHEDEMEYEYSINYNTVDPGASITAMSQIIKVRKLNKAIIESLKFLYDYRCQLCGNDFSYRYGVHIAESHHIDPFVKSHNNDASNQIIICPNHHSTIHKAQPVFDFKTLVFKYANKVDERLLINKHLLGVTIT